MPLEMFYDIGRIDCSAFPCRAQYNYVLSSRLQAINESRILYYGCRFFAAAYRNNQQYTP